MWRCRVSFQKKKIKNHGFFIGSISEILRRKKINRIILYWDGEEEDLSLRSIQILSRIYPLPPPCPIREESEIPIEKIPFMSNNINFISQNVHSFRSDIQQVNLDIIIDIMARKNNNAYCIQETLLDVDFVKEIDGYTIFHHGLKEQIYSRGQNGGEIILSPTFSKYYKSSGSLPPVICKDNDLTTGRFIGLKLNIEGKVKGKNKGAFSKKKVKPKSSNFLFLQYIIRLMIKIKYSLIPFFLQYIVMYLKICLRFRSRDECEYSVSPRKK